MKYPILISLFLLLLAVEGWAQEKKQNKRLIHSQEYALQIGRGGGMLGAQVKVNHHWWEKKNSIFQSGLSYDIFAGPDFFNTVDSETSGFFVDNHLRAYTGIHQSFFKRQRLFISFEGYLGIYHIHNSGSLVIPDFDIDQRFSNNALVFDFGSRLGLGYRLNDKLSIQLVLNNSWKQVNNGLGPLVGLLAGGPDGKMGIGLGLIHRW